uniref:LSM family member 14B n=1 Tax=Sphaeramia orbicularis TaxID=375764 RepID=A0A673CQK9_9TELE
MSSANVYLGCKISLISKAQNRYEGILYTIDKLNSTVVLAKVKCHGTEGRPTDRPTPPKDDVYEYITFRGSDIQSLSLCEPPRSHGLPQDPAIVQSTSAGMSGSYSHSPLQMSAYNQLTASSLLNRQFAAFGLGPVWVRRVEKAVQTVGVERARQKRTMTASQERQICDIKMGSRAKKGLSTVKEETQQQHVGNNENKPPPRRRQGMRRPRNRSRGQLKVAKVPSAILKFDTDFDFDSSNAQFIKDELERECFLSSDGNHEAKEKERGESCASFEDHHFGPKCYYNKAKSFFDNISSDNFRLSWAEERKLNRETFGVPGWFLRSRSVRGGYTGWRAWSTIQTHRTRSGQV